MVSGVHRTAARKDANQDEIVEALQAAGCVVWNIRWPVDLLVRTHFGWLPMEVKTKNGRITDDQSEFIATAGDCPVALVRDVEGALRAAGVTR